MYRIIFCNLMDPDRELVEFEAVSVDDAVQQLRNERQITEREALLGFKLCQMISLQPQVGLVRFEDGSRYDGRVAS